MEDATSLAALSLKQRAAPCAKVKMEFHTAVCRDKAEGMFLGVFLGDALGAPCESLPGNKKKAKDFTGSFHADWFYERTNRYGHKVRHELGQATDDSEMTATLLDVVVRRRASAEHMIEAYINWANSGTFSLGTNTRNIFHGYKQAGTYYKRFDQHFHTDEMREGTQSNGHLMRSSPIALIDNASERQRVLEADCGLTNPSSVALKSEEVYLAVMRLCLLSTDDVEKTICAIREYVRGESDGAAEGSALKQCFEDALASVFTRDVHRQKGWTLHALSVALYVVMCPGTFRENLETVIRFGGDTDTNGCIAGGLLGALTGKRKMLEDATTAGNVEDMKKCKPSITKRTRDGPEKCIPRPSEYTWAHVEALLDIVRFSAQEEKEPEQKRARLRE